VVVHLGPRGGDAIDLPLDAAEVGSQHLDGGGGRALANRLDGPDELCRPLVGEIVAVDTGQDHVTQAKLGDRLGRGPWLVRIDRPRPTGGDAAEPTRARAHVAEQHERHRTAREAAAQVRAARLLADRVEPAAPEHAPHARHPLRGAGGNPAVAR
jgi:hypothetical protein